MSNSKVSDSVKIFSLDDLELYNVEAERVTYRGKEAIRIVELSERQNDGYSIAILVGSDFTDGVIETAIAGDLLPDAPAHMRGFIGIAFRVQGEGEKLECFYLRPTNGRADEQLRRNHATQYISHPDYPWHRLREENPGVYESYTDLIAGEWTTLKIVVSGEKAQLYVNDADQPCLIVNDLKLGKSSGRIALWMGIGTEAHFSEIIVRQNLR